MYRSTTDEPLADMAPPLASPHPSYEAAGLARTVQTQSTCWVIAFNLEMPRVESPVLELLPSYWCLRVSNESWLQRLMMMLLIEPRESIETQYSCIRKILSTVASRSLQWRGYCVAGGRAVLLSRLENPAHNTQNSCCTGYSHRDLA